MSSRRTIHAARVLTCVAACVLAAVRPTVAQPSGEPKPLTQYHLETWQTRDGLPTNAIRAMVQTVDGFLWLGTEAGLVRFDGLKFRVYDRNSTPALRATDVTALFEDREHQLWIGTDDGALIRMRDDEFEEMQAHFATAITTFYQDQGGTLWAAGGNAIGRVSSKGGAVIIGSAYQSGTVTSIFQEPGGSLHLGTTGPELRVDGDILVEVAGGPKTIQAAVQDPDGTLWFGLPTGLKRTGGDRPDRLFTAADGLPNVHVTALTRDHRGGLWIGTTAGVARLVGDRIVALRESDPQVESLNVSSLIEDREGTIWVGTREGGLLQVRDVPFRAITAQQGLPNNDVISVLEDHAGGLWVGTQGGGLTQLNSNGRITWTMQEGLPSNVIQSLGETRDGAIWVGTGPGLARIAGGRVTSFAGLEGYPKNGVRAILEDHTGALWVGTRQGLWRLRAGEVKQLGPDDGFRGKSVSVLRQERDGTIWIGTIDNGLIRYRHGKFSTYSANEGLRSNDVSAILCDDNQNVWVGTADGTLHVVRNDRVLALPAKEGVSSGHPLQILDDGRGSIWVTGERGVTRFDRSDLIKVSNSQRQATSPTVYDYRDGFGRWEFQGQSGSSGVRRADGSLALPSATGVIIVRPEAFAKSTILATARVLEVLADGTPIETEPELVLPPGVKTVEIRYTATSLAVPSRVNFSYRLEGADADFVDAGTRRAAFYSNLRGGRYRFRVTATNADGVQNPKGDAVAFRVELQFWETWWFYALAGVGLLFTIFQVSRFRVHRAQSRERALRVVVDERTKELSQEIAERRRVEASLRQSRDELEDRVEDRTTELRAALAQTQKDMAERRRLEEQLNQVQKLESIGRLAGGVAHDINNVLTVVLSYSDLVDAGLGKSHPLQAQLRQIRKAAERASNLTHRLLAFARKQIVEPRVINLGELAQNLDGMLRRLIGEDVELLTVTSPNLWSVKADPHQIEQVLVNLAVNARDAMPQGGTLRIETTNVVVDEPFARRHPTLQVGDHVRLSVSDTGVGMDEHVMQHMFEPFFTTKEPGKGTGLGLATCYGIVQQLGGVIYPESELGKGTIFSVFIPRVDLPAEPTPRVAETAIQRGTETVLLVEDEPLVREIAKSALSDQGYQVLEAEHGEDALQVANEHDAEIQIVLTDVVMPKMGGRELVENLRRTRSGIRVLYMSGYTAAGIDEQDVVEPGTAFLRKPFALAEMLSKVRDVLDVDAPASATPVQSTDADTPVG